ncbi:MAG: HAMP domain-containing protein, partial [Leptonema sp. (in: Bacteria)]|nr:HAMP domain-containing protein [Leptonema sp. (in: bacteria)]
IQKSKLLAIIDKEITLSTLIANDYSIKKWVLNEADHSLKTAANAQIDDYRKLTDDQTIFITIANSHHYYTFLEKEVQVNTLYQNNQQDRWFFNALHEIDNYRLNTDYDQNVNRTKVWINTIMRDNFGRKIAVVGSGVDISTIIKEIVETQETGVSIYLIDDKNVIQAAKNQSIVMQNAQALDTDKIRIDEIIQNSLFSKRLKLALKSQKNLIEYPVQTFSFELMGRTQIAAISFIPHIGWYNVVLVDVSSAISTREFLPIFFVLFFSLLVLTVLISYFIHRYLLKPIEHLTAASTAIAEGNFKTRLFVTRNDEIGKLSNTFNSMTETIEDYTSTLESKVKSRTFELQNANEALAKSQLEIQASIEYASIIQSSILPESSLFDNIFSDSFVWFRPKDSVGGDSYY